MNLEGTNLISHPAGLIDYTLLKPESTRRDIQRLCQEARQFGFYAVCVHGALVPDAVHFLEDSEVRVVTVAGFPHGASDSDSKRFEAEAAFDNGASEIDVVINIGRLKEGDHRFLLRELRDLVEAADERVVKVILETALLTDEEKTTAAKIAVEAGAHFVKTSTGFGPTGATVADVHLLRQVVGPEFGVKAAGGIRSASIALALLQAGANRLGTSSGPAILREWPLGLQ